MPNDTNHPPPTRSELMTITEVAEMWRVSKMTVYRLEHDGELAAVRVGRSFRIPADAVHNLTRSV